MNNEFDNINRYQLISSLNDLPNSKIYRYAYPQHVKTYWRKDNDFYVEKITLGIHIKAKKEDIEREKKIIDSVEEYYGLTKKELYSIFLERFGNQQGFYVADLKNRQYFYCKNYEDLEPILIGLGVKVVA